MARAEIRDLRSQVEALKICKFGLERFSTDNDSIKFYTGFPSYHHLVTFYEFVKPCEETMQYCHTNSTSSPFTHPGGSVAWSLSSSSVGLAQFEIRRTRVISFGFSVSE